MFDKKTVEEKLNSDDEYLKDFLKNPDMVLKAEGLALSEEKCDKLRSQLNDLQGKVLPAGSSVAANGIMISISKSF